MRRCYVMLTVFYQSPNKLFLYSLILHCCKIERLGKSSYRNLQKIETFWDVHTTQCQDEFRNLSGCVIKILTAGRILQISISWCQIEAEIRSFPTMYGKGGYMW